MKTICVERSEIKAFVEEHHYSGSINGIKSTYCFGLYKDGILKGASIFGMLSTTAWKKYGGTEKDVIELRRLVTLPNLPANTLSKFVAECIRYIKQHSEFKVVVSYADPYYGHHGGIYQACNFLYLGETSKDTILRDKHTGKSYHSRAMRTKYKGELKPFARRLKEQYDKGELEIVTVPGKHIYVYPLKKTHRKRFINISLIYPRPSQEDER